MKGILINPFDETIKDVVVTNDYKDIYLLIDCSTLMLQGYQKMVIYLLMMKDCLKIQQDILVGVVECLQVKGLCYLTTRMEIP